MTDNKKVMDIAKPGEGDSLIGSKPMIIGHTSKKDPMVKEAKDVSAQKSTKVEPPSKARKIIAPLEEDNKPKSKDDETAKDTKEVAIKEVSDSGEPSQPTTGGDNKDELQSDLQKESTPESLEKEEFVSPSNDAVDELVDSKKYFVTIHPGHDDGGSRRAIVSFLLTLVVGVAALLVLIDAEIIDLGVTLPFDFL